MKRQRTESCFVPPSKPPALRTDSKDEDDEDADIAYQEYIFTQALKLKIEREKRRIEGRIDDQLSGMLKQMVAIESTKGVLQQTCSSLSLGLEKSELLQVCKEHTSSLIDETLAKKYQTLQNALEPTTAKLPCVGLKLAHSDNMLDVTEGSSNVLQNFLESLDKCMDPVEIRTTEGLNVLMKIENSEKRIRALTESLTYVQDEACASVSMDITAKVL